MSFLCFMFFGGGAVGVVLIQFNKHFRPVAENVPFGSFITASKNCHRCSRLSLPSINISLICSAQTTRSILQLYNHSKGFLVLNCRYGDWNHSSLEQYTKECTTFTYKESVCKTGDNLTTCFDFLEEVPCSSYVHDMSGSDSFWSLSSEYDWVCDKAEYGSNVLMAQNVGIIISTLIFMQLSDKWGRRPVFHLTNIIYIVMRIISLYITHNYWAYMIVIAIGSTFCPLGVRIGYTVGMYQ
jgi:hypothetical protein